MSRLRILLSVALVGMALAALAGCGYSGSATTMQVPAGLHGSVHGGRQPVNGTSIQIYAAGMNGVGSAAPPLLSTPVKSDSAGNFSVPTSFYCPSASSQLYLIARGGDNPQLAMMAMLGSCSSLSASTAISVNEVTTVGSVWPLAAYMKTPDDLGSTAGDANFLAAVSSVNEFVNIADGSSPGVSTTESYFAQNSKLYSLADVLDKCVNSRGGSAGDGSPCGALFSVATPTGGSAPTDTVTAAMHIAQNPKNKVAPIFDLSADPAAFQPTLAAVPPDWTLSLSHPVATPSISLATGTYVGGQEVTITDSTAGTTIYYTIDGAAPTSSSAQYSGALSIGVTSTVQAIAVLGISQSPVASSTLTITTTTAGAKLAFLQQPSNASTQAVISPAVTVAVEDAKGNIVSSASDPVTLNLVGSTVSSGGTISVAPVNGIATFSNLIVTAAGSGYSLAATSPGLTPATSATFTIGAPLGVTVTPGSVTLTPSQTQTFTAAVAGTSNAAVTWSLTPAVGNISATGVYTAPATVPSPGTLTVTATSVSDPTQSASATITIIPFVGALYYLSPASAGGSDSNDGLSPNSPWLTPNHPVNCGDVILASPGASYASANFSSGKWGTVTCKAGDNVAWLKCATFDACKIRSGDSGVGGIWVDHSYWGIQGWEVTTTGGPYAGCFAAKPSFTTPVEIHHIIFANNVANGCQGGGFESSNVGTTASVDYLAIVGNIAYDSSQGNGECFSGISVYQPIASDTLAGTHIYIAGNLSYDNVDPASCAGGTSTDGEGIVLDTLNGSQGGLAAYAQQILVDNNIAIFNGASGINNGGGGNSLASVYFRHNTIYGNWTDGNHNVQACGQFLLEGYPAHPANSINLTQAYLNLAVPSGSTEPGCGSNPAYAYYVYNVTSTNKVYANLAYSAAGNNTGSSSSSGFSYGPDNVVGTNPGFVNPVDPGAPNCGAASSVPSCMATVISHFMPTVPSVAGYGYQAPLTSQDYDPLFPQWLCNTNLQAGLVPMGCKIAP